MSAYKHWFITRQKRQLTQILPALICFNDICDGEVWQGNPSIQYKYEDELQTRSITQHGSLRARRAKTGGGGIRTLFAQMKDLGLIFAEEDNHKVHLTLVGEQLIKADITFVEAMRIQLSRYQYPSATRWSGNGAIDHNIKVHPFLFMFRLLRDSRLDGYITMNEMKLIIIHEAISDSKKCFDNVVASIIDYRNTEENKNGIKDTRTNTYSNIANTFFNYIELTQYIDRGYCRILIRPEKVNEIDALIEKYSKFIPNPDIQENFQRAFGIGTSTKDLRSFDNEKKFNRKSLEEARIKSEYALLKLETPITTIDENIVRTISNRTGINEDTVESFLIKNFPTGSIDDFFLTYKDYAYGGRKYATEFELATVEIFHKIFGMTAKHVGPIGNTPDVFVESDTEHYCGIIDNKAYEKGYSITGDHRRRMVSEYIPNVSTYALAKYPLAFFSYISTDFTRTINEQLKHITDDTGVNGSAMPVDIFINFAQDYKKEGYTHKHIKELFSVNRKVSIADI